jgi:hypothetical protein
MVEYTGKSLKDSKKISTLMKQRSIYALDAIPRYFPDTLPFPAVGALSFYGRINSAGFTVEPMYDYVLESLVDTEESLFVLDFVADQYAVMKNKYEALSRKSGTFGVLTPKRATIRGDILYEEHIDEFIDSFIENLFTASAEKIVNFHRFCLEFIRFVKKTRSGEALAVSKALFYSSARAPMNVSGLVIDFESDGFNDDTKKQNEWLKDGNFKLYCDAADNAGFYVDLNHPWRIIANLSSKKMQRAAEWHAGGRYRPGTAGDIFSKYHFNVCEYDFLILKNKLFQAYDEIVFNRPEAKRPFYCGKGNLKVETVPREKLNLENLLIPPLPGQDKQNIQEFFGENDTIQSLKAQAGVTNTTTRYGLHNDKYNIIYWLKFYVEIRYHEIEKTKNFLTEREKNAIVSKAVKKLKRGDISGALLYIGEQFFAYRLVDH